MKEPSILKQMKQSLQNLLCRQDKRKKISLYDFVTSLMLSFQHDSKRVLTGKLVAHDEGAFGTGDQPQCVLGKPVAPTPKHFSAGNRVSLDESSLSTVCCLALPRKKV